MTAKCIIYDEGKRQPHDKYMLYDHIVDTVLHKRYSDKERLDPIRERLAALAPGMHTGEELGQQRSTPEATASDGEIDAILQAYQQLDGATDKGVSDAVRVRERQPPCGMARRFSCGGGLSRRREKKLGRRFVRSCQNGASRLDHRKTYRSCRFDQFRIAVGVVDIKTDVSNRLCSFRVAKSTSDYRSRLAELAKTNSHLVGYEIQ